MFGVKQLEKFLEEFRKFISRGNVIDLAVAFIMGGAFKDIVSSMVNDIVAPIIGIFLGGIDFSGLTITLGKASIKYGSFIQATINFLIISSVAFLLIYSINKLHEKLTGKPIKRKVTESVKLLTEIRDLLKKTS